MTDKTVITAAQLRAILHYNPRTGAITHKHRGVSHFTAGSQSALHNCATWNAKYAGTPAGSVDDKGYIQINLMGKKHKAHRIAWAIVMGFWPRDEIDHKNGCRSDNRWSNLREATSTQNKANCGIRTDNRSGFKGVSFHKQTSKWEAYIRVDKKRRHLGLYETALEASAAYFVAAYHAHGDFARSQ